jgi:hypothetical protein
VGSTENDPIARYKMALADVVEAQRLQEFVTFASSFATLRDRRQYLDDHPHLLSDQTIALADILSAAWAAEGLTQALLPLRLFRNLLRACQQLPLAKVFREYEPPSETTWQAVAALLRTDNITAALHVLGTHKGAFTATDLPNVYNYLRAQWEGNEDKLAWLDACWDLLAGFGKPETSNDLSGGTA